MSEEKGLFSSILPQTIKCLEENNIFRQIFSPLSQTNATDLSTINLYAIKNMPESKSEKVSDIINSLIAVECKISFLEPDNQRNQNLWDAQGHMSELIMRLREYRDDLITEEQAEPTQDEIDSARADEQYQRGKDDAIIRDAEGRN